MIRSLALYQLIIFIALGLAVLLFGYRIKKIAFFIVWFILGFNATMWLLPTLNNMVPQIAENALWQNLLPIGGGLLLALLGFSIEKLCVGGICFVLVILATIQYFGNDLQTLAIGAVVGVIVAGAAVALIKPATIIATSAVGAYALTLTIFAFFGANLDFNVFYWPVLLGITTIGSLFQFLTTKNSG